MLKLRCCRDICLYCASELRKEEKRSREKVLIFSFLHLLVSLLGERKGRVKKVSKFSSYILFFSSFLSKNPGGTILVHDDANSTVPKILVS